ncbi:Hercynylcysteine sulfoxide lyase [Colletotrichum orbiculare MAFF 240422]|uniref:Hercynylcysteine sulfoxide lyase n=1 Tax=Colletotrichum orbiculare (strain 104-T / ATCC 96160 / CBS 514.97 / LARS 414 / MAFF 240422) TaxID=1213857 RepID=N4UKU0_COLOR|nr:Hercynylcysteine sulfoxide lyase [Colletotrichum orbiculare MAFF 240422]
MGDYVEGNIHINLHVSPPKFGKHFLGEFLLDPSYRNLNHSSYGAIPRHVQRALRAYQDEAEARPDPFIRFTYHDKLRESRQAIADLLHVPRSTVVFVPNATTGINTVLRNLTWDADGRDEILYFNTIYGACGKTISYIVDTRQGLVSARGITLTYPLEDEEIIAVFRSTVAGSRREGKRPKVCLFDVVSSTPGVRFPFEAMVAACRELGIVSLVDGAQGVGMIPLDLATLDPDYFVSNCHKWLHVPRASAVFYVPERNQHRMASTVPTSHGYAPRTGPKWFNPLPEAEGETQFEYNFGYVGTLDNSPHLCVKDALEWRASIGGEDKIMAYMWALAKQGGNKAAALLGTHVLDNKAETMTKCGMVNVALPVVTGESAEAPSTGPDGTITVPGNLVIPIVNWMVDVLVAEYQTFVALFWHDRRWYMRLSAQVYVDEEDFEWIARKMMELCQRVAKQEYKYNPEPR